MKSSQRRVRVPNQTTMQSRRPGNRGCTKRVKTIFALSRGQELSGPALTADENPKEEKTWRNQCTVNYENGHIP